MKSDSASADVTVEDVDSAHGQVDSPNSAPYLRSMVLVGLYWAWMFLQYWSDAVVVPPILEAGGEYVLRGACAFGTFAVLLVVHILSRAKAGKASEASVRTWRICSVALMPDAALYSLALLIGVPYVPVFAAVCWALSGVGAGFMVMLVGLKFCTADTDTAVPMIYQSIFLAVAVGVLVLISNLVLVEVVAMVCIPVLGGLSFKIEERNRAAVDHVLRQKVSLKKSPLRHDSNRLQVQMFVYSCAFAMTQFVLLNMSGGSYGVSFVWVCFFFSAVAFCVYGVWLSKYVSIGAAQVIFLSLVSAAIPPLAGASGVSREVTIACCAIVAFGFTAYECITLYSLSRTVLVHDVSFTRHFSMGRLANAIGIFVGWMAAFFLHGAQGLIPARPEVLTLLSGIVVAGLVAVVLFNIRNNVASMTLPVRSLRVEPQPLADPEHYWREACSELEERYGLSPRECDVFRLMSKGRDARYICDALCISMHTTKSHTYHIYQKMDVHSQQDLITAVEVAINERLG